jgi:rhamnose utilization protein RhaD (predicted bifunctional aldolase and dehydrogenase)
LHAINPLTYLVLQDAKTQIEEISKALPWKSAFIEYFKPGAELAQAIDIAMKMQDGIRVLFLKNHGIVIGGDSIPEVRSILEDMLKACPTTLSPELAKFPSKIPEVPVRAKGIYRAFEDIEVQQLAQNPSLFNRLDSDWVLYPDHAVFLGPKAFTHKSWGDFFSQCKEGYIFPELIFIENDGVFTAPNFNLSKIAQLRCYFDVISRVVDGDKLNPIENCKVMELLNWDAEKIRQNNSV